VFEPQNPIGGRLKPFKGFQTMLYSALLDFKNLI